MTVARDVLARLADWAGWALNWSWDFLLGQAKDHPHAFFLLILFLVRQFGTTVRSGTRGVLFSFGRARRVLEPGFHPLLPVVHHVRKTPIRSVTLDLPKQRVTTSDDLVYDVQANLVYRVAAPVTSMVQIDNLRKGIEAVLPALVQEMLRVKARAEMVERTGFDEEFLARAGKVLERWGVVVEQAGFKTIAPTPPTLRLTQLAQLAAERARVLEWYVRAGLSPELAVALLGSERRCLSHAAHRYRTARRRALLRRQRAGRLRGPEKPLPKDAARKPAANEDQAVPPAAGKRPDGTGAARPPSTR